VKIFAFGSSILSSYWNGAATYYRGCYKYLARLGYDITFAEPDAYGRQQHRDAGDFSYVTSIVYQPTTDLGRMLDMARQADIVIKHSGIGVDDAELERRVLECSRDAMCFFWDVDAPATLHRMRSDPGDALRQATPGYDAILTYGGGPKARRGFVEFGARAYYSIYNALDPDTHHPVPPDPELACRGVVSARCGTGAGSAVPAGRRGMERQSDARERSVHRARADRDAQPCQLLGPDGDEH
jgi:spore maturation protein CgeB